MLIIDDAGAPANLGDLEIVHAVGRRRVSCAVHDIDGTHSLIRDWPPVMSRVLHAVVVEGLPTGYDNPVRVEELSYKVGCEKLPETNRFCVESAGLSALTQMEWAIRRGIEAGTVALPEYTLTPDDRMANSAAIADIWDGNERSGHEDPPEVTAFLHQHAPRLFRLYEKVLNSYCRDCNLEAAGKDPEPWRVRGSIEFLSALHGQGVRNFFVTGAVVDDRSPGGIREEVQVLGYDIGPDRVVEAIMGSRWDTKRPKAEVLQALCDELGLDPGEMLIVGDGRAEIRAGRAAGAVTLSRLSRTAVRGRQIHRTLGTNYIVSEYRPDELKLIMPGIDSHW